MNNKQVMTIGIILFLISMFFIGCVENKGSNENGQNQLPVPVITLVDYPLWWNDTFSVSAEESFDSDGNILEYRWIFETKESYGSIILSSDSRTGINTNFVLPDFNDYGHSLGDGKLTLSVTDDNGATAFAHYDIPIRHRPIISFEQVNSSLTKFIIRYVNPAINSTGYVYPLKEPEIWLKIYEYNLTTPEEDPWKLSSWGSLGYNYKDTDGDGNITTGDTFTIDDMYIGYKLKLELIGGQSHNRETVVGSLEAEIE
jgi:hypothetical protein